MKLRLYHHHDGARIAYREIGTGPPLALLHSALMSHMEWEPAVRQLAERHRVVLPDLPLHGDSEDRPRHPYTLDWFTEVLCGFFDDVLGPKPIVGGHEMGAEIVLHGLSRKLVAPERLVLMPSRMHAAGEQAWWQRAWGLGARAGAVPGVDWLMSHATKALFTPELGVRLTARNQPSAGDLIRHAFADVPGNPNWARSWAKCARQWPRAPRRQLLELYPTLDMPVLLLWADHDAMHPLANAEEALALMPAAQLRVLEGTGFLMAYDDPVALAREISAFCG